MKRATTAWFGWKAGLPILALLSLGCTAATPGAADTSGQKPATPAPEAKKVLVGPNVWFEVQGDQRRVLVSAEVCLREGQLELFLCRKHTKEHEAILSADVNARDIHTALLLAGAKPGAPVQFEPKYQPARGTRIRIQVQYEDKGKLVRLPAQQWIRSWKTKKDLDADWVFAGSLLQPNPDGADKPPLYLANGGNVICVSNFEDALLDVPIVSPKDNDDLVFEAHTERIPALGTKVVVLLEPEPEGKK